MKTTTWAAIALLAAALPSFAYADGFVRGGTAYGGAPSKILLAQAGRQDTVDKLLQQRDRNKDLAESLRRSQEARDRQTQHIANLEAQVDRLAGVIKVRDQRVSELSNIEKQLRRTVAVRDEHVADLSQSVDQLRSTLARRDKQLADLEAVVFAQERDITRLQEQVDNRSSRLEDNRARAQRRGDRLDELRTLIDRRDARIADLQQQVERLQARLARLQ
ncbi:hypothetical protein L1787_04245 [Acuticoccus sp. M5D2P5]|uniref:hypothetical protein n=1 Tax=Acuticoccus kalidii TaxID=2910977 RepID=UPI001F35DBDB|nr:hypothetical protein [Acuticoccus kalidii]MCF3932627.1 hypothetical protein [Acuticoccus kalidii]